MNAKPNAPRYGGNKTRGRKNGAPEPQPTATTSSAEPASPETKDKCHKTEKHQKHWLDYATAWFAFVAAIGGIGAAIFGGLQGWISRDTEKRQLRAYVGVSPGDVENFGSGDQRLRLIRKNYGGTPAYDVGFSEIGFVIEPVGNPLPTTPQGCMAPRLPGLVSMFPSMELSLTINIQTKFPSEQLLAVLALMPPLIPRQ